jgi:HTH-type transcriptional regulator / antitoxin HipB
MNATYVYMLALSSYVATIDSTRDLSTLVQGRRRSLGLSQEQLAARANVSRQWLSAFERGRPGSELQLILRLMEALDLRLSAAPIERGKRPEAPDGIDLDAILDDHRG